MTWLYKIMYNIMPTLKEIRYLHTPDLLVDLISSSRWSRITSLMYSYQARISVISPNLPSRTLTLIEINYSCILIHFIWKPCQHALSLSLLSIFISIKLSLFVIYHYYLSFSRTLYFQISIYMVSSFLSTIYLYIYLKT